MKTNKALFLVLSLSLVTNLAFAAPKKGRGQSSGSTDADTSTTSDTNSGCSALVQLGQAYQEREPGILGVNLGDYASLGRIPGLSVSLSGCKSAASVRVSLEYVDQMLASEAPINFHWKDAYNSISQLSNEIIISDYKRSKGAYSSSASITLDMTLKAGSESIVNPFEPIRLRVRTEMLDAMGSAVSNIEEVKVIVGQYEGRPIENFAYALSSNKHIQMSWEVSGLSEDPNNSLIRYVDISSLAICYHVRLSGGGLTLTCKRIDKDSLQYEETLEDNVEKVYPRFSYVDPSDGITKSYSATAPIVIP